MSRTGRTRDRNQLRWGRCKAMHGRQGEERKQRQHMWSVPAPGTAAAVEKPAVILQPPAPAANLVQTSADSFLKVISFPPALVRREDTVLYLLEALN